MLFDSHAHINNESFDEEEREALIAKIEASKVDYVMDIGFNPESSELAVKHANRLSWCYAAVGCHPHDTKDMDEEKLDRLRELAQEEKVRAIGEIGLDFYYDYSDRDAQRYWFRRQIQLANEQKMPIVIHAREADQEVMDILREEGAFSEERKSWFPQRYDGSGDARVLLHCFSGSRELGQQYVKLGATISVAGPVTYKNNKKTVAVVEALPIEVLLVETDSPYLTPVPFRGKRNIPPYVEYTAAKVAEIKGLTLEETAARTKENAMRFYGITE